MEEDKYSGSQSLGLVLVTDLLVINLMYECLFFFWFISFQLLEEDNSRRFAQKTQTAQSVCIVVKSVPESAKHRPQGKEVFRIITCFPIKVDKLDCRPHPPISRNF